MAVGLRMQPHAVDPLASQVGGEAFDHRREVSSRRMVLLCTSTRLVKMEREDMEGSTVESASSFGAVDLQEDSMKDRSR